MAPSKQKYIALLRAVNVGGASIMKMADLRRTFELLGFADVATYVQSGNVLFTAKETVTEQLKERLGKKLKFSLGNKVTVFVLTPEQLKKAALHNPFGPERLDKEQQCHLMFLSRTPDAAHRRVLSAMQGKEYRFFVRGRVLYIACPRAFEGRRRTIDFEKVLGVAGTMRTWKVVNKLIDLALPEKKRLQPKIT